MTETFDVFTTAHDVLDGIVYVYISEFLRPAFLTLRQYSLYLLACTYIYMNTYLIRCFDSSLPGRNIVVDKPLHERT